MDAPQRDRSSSGVPVRTRVAIVHDYLTQRGGAERVVLSLCRAFPDAPLYASFYDPDSTFSAFREHDVRTLWLDRARAAASAAPARAATPAARVQDLARRRRRRRLQLERLGARHSRRAVARSSTATRRRSGSTAGTTTSAPIRGACQPGLRALDPLPAALRPRAAARADTYLANSTFIASQMREVYGIEAEVVFPPVGLDADGPSEPVPDVDPGFLLTVARLLPYKNVAQTVDAFRAATRAAARRRRRRARTRTARGRRAGQRAVRRRGRRREAALALRELRRAGRRLARGLRPHACRGCGLRQARRRSPLGRLPRHGGARRDRRLLRLARAQSDRRGGRAPRDARWDADAIRRHAATFSEERFVERIREIALGRE